MADEPQPPKRLSPDEAAGYKPPTPASAETPQRLSPADAATYTAPQPQGGIEGWLGNKPDDDRLTGGLKNVISSVIEGVPHIAFGLPGDLMEAGLGVGSSVVEKFEKGKKWLGLSGEGEEPRSRQKIEAQWRAGLKAINDERIDYFKRKLEQPDLSEADRKVIQANIDELTQLGGVLPTGADIYKKAVVPALKSSGIGRYEAQSPMGRFTHSAIVSAVPSAVTPGLGALQGARAGAVAGVASQGLTETGIEDPLAHFAASFAAPYAEGRVSGTGRRAIFGLNSEERYAAAAKALAKNTKDAEAALQRIREREAAGVPSETLAEATGEQGHARAQDILITRGSPQMVEAMEALRVARNLEMQHTLRGQGMNATPEALAEGFDKHLEILEREAAAKEPAAGQTMDVSGANLIEQVHGAGGPAKTEKARLDAVKKNIDPDGTLGTWSGDITKFAKENLAEATTQPEKGRGKIADKLIEQAAGFGDMKSYRALDQFMQTINRTLNEVPHGGLDYNALLDLKQVVKDAQKNAVANQHKIDQAAVARGELDPNQTLAAKLQQSVDDWVQSKRGEGPPIFGQQNMRPVDPQTVQTLDQFNVDWGTYKDTFKKGPVGEAEPQVGKTPKPAAQVAESAFKSGSSGFEIANAWIKAGGEDAVTTLKEIATNRLQTELSKGRKTQEFDEGALKAFKAANADALRAIDDADRAAGRPPFSETFNEAASARQLVTKFEDSSAGNFLGLKHPDDIVLRVGRIINGTDSALQMAELMQQAKATPNGEATVAGLRRAAARFVEQDIQRLGEIYRDAQGNMVPVFGGPQIKQYMLERGDTLRQVFDPEAIKNIEKLIEINNNSVAVRTAGLPSKGSPTMERKIGEDAMNAAVDAALGLDAKSGNLTTGGFLSSQLYFEAGKAMLSGHPWEATKHAGLAVLNDTVGRVFARRGLRGKIDVYNLLGKAFSDRDVGAAMLQKIVDDQGRPNVVAIDMLAKALIASETEAERRKRLPKTYARVGRASGGRIKFDCASRASKLCREAELIRKKHGGQTKQYLNVPDDVVADALRVAGGRL